MVPVWFSELYLLTLSLSMPLMFRAGTSLAAAMVVANKADMAIMGIIFFIRLTSFLFDRLFMQLRIIDDHGENLALKA